MPGLWKVIAKLTQAGQILDAKAPGDAPAFKTWLKQVQSLDQKPQVLPHRGHS
jgi:hypothetical protein